MENTITKPNQFPFLGPPIPKLFSQFMTNYPYLTNYFNPTLNSALNLRDNTIIQNSWLNGANSTSGCSSPISPNNGSSNGRCPICFISMQGVDANQHFIEEVQKLEALRKAKENEEKCKMDLIDFDIENRNDEHGLLQILVRRNSRLTSRYQTYLRIKQNRETRKMKSYRNQKRFLDEREKTLNTIASPSLGSLTAHQLSHFSLSAAHNNLLLQHHQQQQQQAQAQINNSNVPNSSASSLLFNDFLLKAAAAASCNSPSISNSNATGSCLDNTETNLNLSNGTNLNVTSLGGNGLNNSQSNGLMQDRINSGTPGSSSSTPLTAFSSLNGLNGTNNVNNSNNNGSTTPTSTNNNSPVTTLSSLNGSMNAASSLQNTKTSPTPVNAIWSIASITGLNAAVASNFQNLNNLGNLNNLSSLSNLNNLNNLNNELKRCLSDEEDEDLEITDDRDSIASDK